MTVDCLKYTDAEMAELRRFYSEGEVVEIMAAVSLFNYFNRFNNLLQMEPTQPATPEELAGSLTGARQSVAMRYGNNSTAMLYVVKFCPPPTVHAPIAAWLYLPLSTFTCKSSGSLLRSADV
jgi:hypothetical protein